MSICANSHTISEMAHELTEAPCEARAGSR